MPKKKPEDLQFRIAYKMAELPYVLPFSTSTIENMIAQGIFPEGVRPHSTSPRIWPRATVESWLARMNQTAGNLA